MADNERSSDRQASQRSKSVVPMSGKEQEEPISHEAIAEKFQELRSQNSQLASRLNDLASELAVRRSLAKQFPPSTILMPEDDSSHDLFAHIKRQMQLTGASGRD